MGGAVRARLPRRDPREAAGEGRVRPRVGYVRVSTDRQAGEAQTSLADQQRAIEALASSLGLTVERWYRDEGASGATVEKRPALRQLVADIEAAPRSQKAPGFVLVLN